MIFYMKNPKITVITSLFNCAQYLEGYFKCIASLKYKDELEILLLHNAPTDDEIRIIQSHLALYPFLKHHIIKNREGLYATWNRGIMLAKGDFIAIWNVDDIRLPLSFHLQLEALNKNPEAVLAYGDFYYMYQYGIPSKDLVCNIDFKKSSKQFLRTFHIGCFPMWRKGIHKQMGYFDEQFKLVADYDFQIRVAINGCLVKSDGILGYYLEHVPGKLSANSFLQKKEQNVVYLRYGIYDLINWVYWRVVFKYKINEVFFNNKMHPLSVFQEHRTKFLIMRTPLFFLSILKQPRNVLSFFKHSILKK
jgi:glycosyltransferase involved in cell wall biosynthesis